MSTQLSESIIFIVKSVPSYGERTSKEYGKELTVSTKTQSGT
jgi:hypothetical protein